MFSILVNIQEINENIIYLKIKLFDSLTSLIKILNKIKKFKYSDKFLIIFFIIQIKIFIIYFYY